MCDNLLTSIVRAWSTSFPLIIAPAMNTEMWDKIQTKEHIERLRYILDNFHVVQPTDKHLACGDNGIGAMADIDGIVSTIIEVIRWNWPFKSEDCPGIPIDNHPGAFGFERKHSKHTGVDLYMPESTPVYIVEPGKVIGIGHFTGPKADSPW
jgi:hypothetical protein